jgi:hypothetical protein
MMRLSGRGKERETYVADGVLGDVDAVLEDAFCARLARCGRLVCCDDLVGCRFDDVFGVKVEELLVVLPAVMRPLVVKVLLAVFDVLLLVLNGLADSERLGVGGGCCKCSSCAQESYNGCCGEVHSE